MAAPHRVGGLHHVTAIAGDPQENLDFYSGVLGMRLVKKSVNQDAPGVYHLFFADGEAHPGTDLTFFPMADAGPGRSGAGIVGEVALAVPPESMERWLDRLETAGTKAARAPPRFGEPVLTLQDPHGLPVALVGAADAARRAFTPWGRGPVPAGDQVRGLHAVRITQRDAAPTAALLSTTMGMRPGPTDDGWTRWIGSDPASGSLDLRTDAGAARSRVGVGAVHHVAFRVPDDEAHAAVHDQVRRAGIGTSGVIDRFWFRSIYFREPGGVLFELATDGPGMTADEPLESLGETLVLPPWLERDRPLIEKVLTPLHAPTAVAASRPGAPDAGA